MPINLFQSASNGSGPPFRRAAIPKGPPFWKPSFMVVAWNSSWYCHNQTTDPNPNPIPGWKWRPFGMAALPMVASRNGGPTPHQTYPIYN